MASLYKRNTKSKRYPKGYVWYAKFTEKGKVKRTSLNTDSVQRARAKLAEIEEAIDSGRPVGHKKDTAVAEFTPSYLKLIRATKRPNTVRNLVPEWEYFLNWLKPLKLSDVSPDDITRYKSHLIEERGLAKSSTIVSLLAVSSAFTHAIEEMGAFEGPNPVQGIKLPKPDKRLPRYLDRNEIEAVLARAKAYSQDMHLVFALGLFTGMRKNEIINARWSWIDLQGGARVHIQSRGEFRTKSGRDRVVPLHDGLCTILEEYEAGDGFIIFPKKPEQSAQKKGYRLDFSHAFKVIVKDAGVEWCTPHILRHTFASWLAIEGVSLYKISTWLGHADLKTTQIYAHLQPQDDDINRL